jgi:hypothetical protein
MMMGMGLFTLGASALAVNTFVIGESGAQVSPRATTHVEPAGVNFTIHTSADTNFCYTNVPVPQLNRTTSIQQCAPNDSQHWTFAQSVDGSSVIVDGSGQCLEASKKANKMAEVNPCTFLAPEHFLYTAKGNIKTLSGSMCLEDAAATSDAAVAFDPCVKGLTTQIWILGH